MQPEARVPIVEEYSAYDKSKLLLQITQYRPTTQIGLFLHLRESYKKSSRVSFHPNHQNSLLLTFHANNLRFGMITRARRESLTDLDPSAQQVQATDSTALLHLLTTLLWGAN